MNSNFIKKRYGYVVIGTFVLVPLIFYNRMMWSFHAPKELFFQFAVFTLLFLHFLRPKTNFKINLLDSAIFLRVIFIAFLFLFTGNMENIFTRMDILLYLILFYCLIQLSDSEVLEYSFPLLSIIGVLLSLYGIMQYYGFDPFHPEGYSYYESKVIATFGNANTTGGFLAAIMPFTFVNLLYSRSRLLRIIYSLGFTVMLWAMVLTLSRGAWLALIVGMFIIALPLFGNLWKKCVYSISRKITAWAGIGMVMMLMGWGLFLLNPASATGRLFVWKITISMVKEHPIVGIGYGRYGTQYLHYQAKFFDNPENTPYFDRADNLKQAHNEYLQVWAETGILGLALFLSIFGLFYKTSFQFLKNMKNSQEKGHILAFTASVTAVGIHALVDSPLRTLPINLVFYFSLAMMSLKAKQRFQNESIVQISFRNHWSFFLVSLVIFVYSTYHIVDKAKGYIHWYKGQESVLSKRWQVGIEEYKKCIVLK